MERRAFVKSGALALVTMGLTPTFLRRTAFGMELFNAPKGKVLICLFQRGAADALNIVVPHGERAYYAMRPSIAIPQPSRNVIDGAIDLDGFFGLHPAMAPLKPLYDRKLLGKVASVIREVAPEIVLTHSPVDYMEDHTNACRLAVTAAFSRGMPNFMTDPPRPAISTSVTVYHAQPYSHRDPLGKPIEPVLVVDTTDIIEQKKQMLSKHASQKLWLDESQGLNSYLDTMASLDTEVGRIAGIFKYAEGWRRHLHLGFCGPDDDPLRTALKERVLVAAAE